MKHFLLLVTILFIAACEPAAPKQFALDMPGSKDAMAPRISSLPGGEILLSWIEPGEVSSLRFAVYDGLEWSEPRVAAEGSDWFNNWADTAGVTALGNGLLVAHWLQKNGESTYAYEVRYAVSSDGGKSWSEPRRAHDDPSASEHGFVSIIPRGNGFEMFWLDGRKTAGNAHAHGETAESDGEIAGMTLRMGRFAADGERLLEQEIDGLTCDCCPTAAARQGDDSLVVYRDRDEQERRDIYLARISEDGEVQRREVHDDAWHMPACPVNGPAVATVDSATHILWFTGVDGKREIRYAVAPDGKSFAEPVKVAGGDAQGRVSLVQAGDELVAMWLAGQGSEGRIQLASLVDGKVGEPVTVDGMSVARRVGYPQLGVIGGGDLLVAWTSAEGLVGKRLQR
ncbi:MAG: sialidase family protein [Gammaproteobacteria bacterium]|nr:sialidase family protein [Gammaproteobacteria bacterium]